LPGRKALIKSDVRYEVVLVEATETPPQKKQQKRYSGKKKRHTMKTQVLVDKKQYAARHCESSEAKQEAIQYSL
jgi:hypothetical protein